MIAIAAATLVVLIVVAAVFLLPSRTAESFRTFANPGTIVPYTVSHPQSWAEQNGVASDAVLSPRPDAVGPTFFQGSADRWGGTRRLLATSPADAVGLYVYAESTGSDTTTDGLKSAIDVLLPDRLTFEPMHRQLTIDGSPADELEGVLEDPTDPKTKLHVLFDVVQPPGRRVGAAGVLRAAGPVRRPAAAVRPDQGLGQVHGLTPVPRASGRGTPRTVVLRLSRRRGPAGCRRAPSG